MKTASGGVPVITQNEARDEFMGLGPVDGGDALLIPNTMTPSGEKQDASDVDPDAAGSTQTADGKRFKQVRRGRRSKAANGERVAFRMSRTKLQMRAKTRKTMADNLTEKITAALKKKLGNPTKNFASTKEQDEARWKEFSEYTNAAQKEVAETMRKINGEQQKEVLANLPTVIEKAIDPTKLFDIDKWISITTDAVSPIMDTLFESQGKAAALEVGKPDLNPMNDLTSAAVKRSVQMMSESYNQTTLATLETQINDGVSAGESLADVTKRVEQIYEWSDTSRAEVVAKTESFRTANSALKAAWQQSGVVKTMRWYTSELANVCDYCQEMNGKTVGIDDNFFDEGDSLTVGQGDDSKTMTMDYGDVGAPPIHVACACFIRPDEIAI